MKERLLKQTPYNVNKVNEILFFLIKSVHFKKAGDENKDNHQYRDLVANVRI